VNETTGKTAGRKNHRTGGRRSLLALMTLAATICLAEGTANAYPQWQFTSGAARCNQCHFSPGGGGVITNYARDAVGEELSSRDSDGAFLYGALPLPSRTALGGDFRVAALGHDTDEVEGPRFAAFPMQAELNGRISWPAGFAIAGTLGLRGQARSASDPVPEQNYQAMPASRLVLREHHLTYMPASLGPYLKAGRYFAPFGLRLSEHFTYVRRDLGFGSLEESYNLSAGWVADGWELHLTGFLPDGLRRIGNGEKGAVGLFEHQTPGGAGAIGLQMRLAYGAAMDRLIVGVTAKQHVPRLRSLLLAEMNLVRQFFSTDAIASRQQFVGLVGVALLPARGWIFTLFGERSQTDIAVANTRTNATSAIVSWFPVAHVELQALGRLQFPAGSPTAKTVLLQLHYFL
jgi:hypothetical protein